MPACTHACSHACFIHKCSHACTYTPNRTRKFHLAMSWKRCDSLTALSTDMKSWRPKKVKAGCMQGTANAHLKGQMGQCGLIKLSISPPRHQLSTSVRHSQMAHVHNHSTAGNRPCTSDLSSNKSSWSVSLKDSNPHIRGTRGNESETGHVPVETPYLCKIVSQVISVQADW